MIASAVLVIAAIVFHAPSAKPAATSKSKPSPGKSAAPPAKAQSTTKPAKTEQPDKAAPKKPQAKPVATAVQKIQDLDRICRRDLSWGKVQAVRDRCADLEPRGSAIATFWRLSLSDDPNDLRKGFAPIALAKSEVDSRLLLAAGRYHFARGQRKEMEDLVEIARKGKIANSEIDTLKRLTAGK